MALYGIVPHNCTGLGISWAATQRRSAVPGRRSVGRGLALILQSGNAGLDGGQIREPRSFGAQRRHDAIAYKGRRRLNTIPSNSMLASSPAPERLASHG